jgi:nickel-dependent lactate racemase
MLYYKNENTNKVLSEIKLRESVFTALDKLGIRKKVLVIPPDFTRYHSYAGLITKFIYNYYGHPVTDILPALGTHSPMTNSQLDIMYNGIPKELFRVHNWRTDITTLGEVPKEFIYEVSEGKVNYPWPAQVNKLLIEGNFDLILSVGQVVPHEVVGMANYNKNIFIGTGGKDGINKSHFLGAVYGMERMMGRADTPVRKVLNYASEIYARDLPIIYFLTVIGKDSNGENGVCGLYLGDDFDTFKEASSLSLKMNFQLLEKPLKKIVVYLDPNEYKSTWLGNKSIYRTRMAIDDDGELIVLAPGLKEFGEDKMIDSLIRKYGYVTTPEILEFVKESSELRNNLSAAAHLIHGSSEGRFNITYCPGKISKEEIESVNFKYADLSRMMKIYDPHNLKEGLNVISDKEEIFFISNPALGLWAYKGKFDQ